MSPGEKTLYTIGLTDWLIVHQREVAVPGLPARVERRYQINPPGLMPALGMIAAGALGCAWAHRRLVHRLSLRAYCDYCGYNLHGLSSGRCPECGTAVEKP